MNPPLRPFIIATPQASHLITLERIRPPPPATTSSRALEARPSAELSCRKLHYIIYRLCIVGLNYLEMFRCNIRAGAETYSSVGEGRRGGVWGWGVGVTRCGADKGVQGPCIAFLSFVPQPRGRQLVGSQRVYLRPPPPTSHMGLTPTPCPPHLRPPPPSICCCVGGCRTEVCTRVSKETLPCIEGKRPNIEAKETYYYWIT